MLWYFAYGSNVSREIFLGRRAMRPLATRSGRLEDFALRFNLPVGPGERGVANLEPELRSHVWGVLYLLSPEEFDRLDRTEGVHRDYYRRVAVEVLTDGAERVEAFAYRSALATPGRKPSARYLGLLLDGARDHGLPTEWVRFLESFELAIDERETGNAPGGRA